MPVSASTALTYEDYLELPNDGKRYEIIEGELFVNPAPNTKHQTVAMNLALALGAFVRREGLGRVYFAPYDVVLSVSDVLQPDLMFITREREQLITRANLQGAPNLVIEILSPSTQRLDATLKLKRYDRFGVDEYWLADPETESIAVYRRSNELLELIDTPDPLTSPLLPDFALAVREVFAE